MFEDHLLEDKKFQDKINRVLFGEDVNDKGMKDKVDEMHAILISAKNVTGFFGSLKNIFAWILVLGALIALFRGAFSSLIIYFTAK